MPLFTAPATTILAPNPSDSAVNWKTRQIAIYDREEVSLHAEKYWLIEMLLECLHSTTPKKADRHHFCELFIKQRSTTRGLNPQSLQLSGSADVFLKLLPSHITAVMSHRGVIDRTLYEGNMFLHNCTKVLFSHVVQIHCTYSVVIWLIPAAFAFINM